MYTFREIILGKVEHYANCCVQAYITGDEMDFAARDCAWNDIQDIAEEADKELDVASHWHNLSIADRDKLIKDAIK